MSLKDGANINTQLDDLRDVCMGKRWLVVLDDVWDKAHEKLLNCIDPSRSKLLVTTRIRGLLQGCDEVSLNLMAKEESIDLLLRTAEIEAADDRATAAAAQIADLCGHLPLYLSICGGIILGYEGSTEWQTEITDLLREDRLGVMEEGSGDDLGARLVDSSLDMLNDNVVSVFMSLGACPEDVLIKLPVVQLICSADCDLANSKHVGTIAMRRSVKILLDRNLLQGSIVNGVQMREFTRLLCKSRRNDRVVL